VALEDENALMKALEVSSLDGLSEHEQRELVRLLPDVAPHLQERLLVKYPALRAPYAVMAIDALEGDLKSIFDSSEAGSREAFAALADARRIVEGEFKKNVSDERWNRLMDMLRELSRMAMEKGTEHNNLISQQANADRVAKMLEKAGPYIDYAVRVGVQIMLARK
jgi:hypothetical protein